MVAQLGFFKRIKDFDKISYTLVLFKFKDRKRLKRNEERICLEDVEAISICGIVSCCLILISVKRGHMRNV